MGEKRFKVETYEVKYICDACGSSEVLPTGVALMSSPPQYPHVCKSCGKEYRFRNKEYPYTEYVTIDLDAPVYD